MQQNELVHKECSYLCVCFATNALALLKLYIQLTRLARVEVAVNVQVLCIQAKKLFFVCVDEPFARVVDGEKAGFFVIGSFFTKTELLGRAIVVRQSLSLCEGTPIFFGAPRIRIED